MGNLCNCFKKEDQEIEEQELIKANKSQQNNSSRSSKKSIVAILDTINEKQGNILLYYSLLNPPIGTGAFGEVRKAIHKASGIVRAVKIINKTQCSESNQKKILNEVKIMKKLDHPNIIKIYEFFQDSTYFYIVQELCTGGDLMMKIQNGELTDQNTIIRIIRQILSAVNYLHKIGIVHRDLKPENILLECNDKNSQIKMIDFGSATTIQDKQFLRSQTGTVRSFIIAIFLIYYTAPEVLKENYNQKCDIWSCGVIFFVLLTKMLPFDGVKENMIHNQSLRGQILKRSQSYRIQLKKQNNQ